MVRLENQVKLVKNDVLVTASVFLASFAADIFNRGNGRTDRSGFNSLIILQSGLTKGLKAIWFLLFPALLYKEIQYQHSIVK